jgi:hypothetical protein
MERVNPKARELQSETLTTPSLSKPQRRLRRLSGLAVSTGFRYANKDILVFVQKFPVCGQSWV